jgi:hypothetical protein
VYARITVADIASLSNLPLAPRVAPARRCLDDIFELIVYKEDLPMSDGLQCAADPNFQHQLYLFLRQILEFAPYKFKITDSALIYIKMAKFALYIKET